MNPEVTSDNGSLPRPNVFISYSRQDEQVADEIVIALESLSLSVWLDRREIRPGDSFVEKMNQGISSANYIVILFSNASLQSTWVSREWMSALASKSNTLIPIRLEAKAIPPLLQDIAYVDFVEDQQQGLEKLKSFFKKEILSIKFDRGFRRGDDINPPPLLEETSRRELRLVAQKCMSETEFRQFVWDEEINDGNIGGDSFNERLINLLHHTAREGTLRNFVVWLNREKKQCVEYQLQQIRQGDI